MAKAPKTLELEAVDKQVNVTSSEKDRKRKWLDEVILVEFRNLEEPGHPLTFEYGTTKNKEKFQLLHSGKYRMRREVAEHIESRSIPIYDYVPDGTGKMHKKLMGHAPRFQCRQIFE